MQGFGLPHYGFDSVQNIDRLKCVPGVCKDDTGHRPGQQDKKKVKKNEKSI